MDHDEEGQAEGEVGAIEQEGPVTIPGSLTPEQMAAVREDAEKAMRCPSCWQTAKVRHCYRCRWLVCRECDLIWSAHSGRFTAVSKGSTAFFADADPRDFVPDQSEVEDESEPETEGEDLDG